MSQRLKIPFQTFIAEGVNSEANFTYNNFTLFNSLNWAIEIHSLSITNLTKEVNCIAELYSPNINQVCHAEDSTVIGEASIAVFHLKSTNKTFHLKYLPLLAFPLTLKNDNIKFKVRILTGDSLPEGLFKVHASLHRI